MTDEEKDRTLHAFTVKAGAQMTQKIEDFMEEIHADDDLGQEGWYLTGQLIMRHQDGWTPGYFNLDGEDDPTFVVSYQEDGR